MLRTMPSYRLKTVQIYCQFLVEDKSIGIVWLKTRESKFIADFVLKTDRPTDQQTELVEEAPSRSLKIAWSRLLAKI